jgi:inward rectifier potassium channel
MKSSVPNQESNNDLGFGTKVAQESHNRLLNRDGSFNVMRKGLSFAQSRSPYHSLITMSWLKFNLLVFTYYILVNVLFGTAYYLCGEEALLGTAGRSTVARFIDDFFFSVQTSTTIGYGRISPVGIAANVLVSVEAMAGLLGFALSTSLLFARFSKPNAKIIFSHQGVIAPYRGITAFEFRIANERSNQLIQVEVSVILSRIERDTATGSRKFHKLSLEREQVVFFPLNWTIVHPIDEKSPLFGVSRESFFDSDPEFLILLTGTDDTFSQTVHARSSYKANEIVWGAKFSDMFQKSSNGIVSVDLHRIHDIEKANVSTKSIT